MNKDDLKARTKEFALRVLKLEEARRAQPLHSAIGNRQSEI
jgi:hypothetical protein